jgi:hypothetical protein
VNAVANRTAMTIDMVGVLPASRWRYASDDAPRGANAHATTALDQR